MNPKQAYFQSRADIGRQYAKELAHLRYENTAILALSPGGVVIGMEIAKELHSLIGLLLLKHIYIPGEQTVFGTVAANGGFTYDNSFSVNEIEEFEAEFRTTIEAEKDSALHQLHTLGQGGILSAQYFNGRNVIIVTDYAKSGTAFKAAMNFLKPARTEKIIMVAPVALVRAVDVMHSLADKTIISHVSDNEFPHEHFYTNNIIPKTDELIELMNQIVLQW